MTTFDKMGLVRGSRFFQGIAPFYVVAK